MLDDVPPYFRSRVRTWFDLAGAILAQREGDSIINPGGEPAAALGKIGDPAVALPRQQERRQLVRISGRTRRNGNSGWRRVSMEPINSAIGPPKMRKGQRNWTGRCPFPWWCGRRLFLAGLSVGRSRPQKRSRRRKVAMLCFGEHSEASARSSRSGPGSTDQLRSNLVSFKCITRARYPRTSEPIMK